MTSGCLYASSEAERSWAMKESRSLESRIESGERWVRGGEVRREVASMKWRSRMMRGVGGVMMERLEDQGNNKV